MRKQMAYNMDKDRFTSLYKTLLKSMKDDCYKQPYSGLLSAKTEFHEPYLKCTDCDLIVLSVMRLLIKYTSSTKSDYGKFTISYMMIIPTGEVEYTTVSYTIGRAITFRESGENKSVYNQISKYVLEKAEIYDDKEICGIFIRIYQEGLLDSLIVSLSDNDIQLILWESIINKSDEVVTTRRMKRSNRSYHNYITSLKPSTSPMKPFLVADTETVLYQNVHIPYAIGFMVVNPFDVLSNNSEIITYYSSDNPEVVFKSFEERSNKMMFDFLERLEVIMKQKNIHIVYFHNLSRFDGIIILKYLVQKGHKYTFKPLLRNNMLYELSVYCGDKHLYSLRDSLLLLPRSLSDLGKNLCPELGSKGTIQHDEVKESNLIEKKRELLDYMKQDILLLGGVLQKSQYIYNSHFNVDIVSKLTLSSLALNIFRTNYYDENKFSIHIPNRNEDTFIRRGYYGGHTDSYIPSGKNLYYYDVNSLYPFIMKEYPMPGGKPVWYDNLENKNLDELYGFIEAYVECPKTIKRPFLPYRDNNNTLLFPTGEFVGVYYSEELKYAHDLGYKIIPLKGYLFENLKNSPFTDFVTTLYSKRQEAKNNGNDALSYIYKILMNSLYGRFGINPKCTTTEICSFDRYNNLIKNSDFTLADKLSDDYYIISYWKNNDQNTDFNWEPPKISAVQLAAAVTACARIYMYKYISRPDCYYTDTDSVVLGSPLPEEEISSTVLGKYKLEYNVQKGIFLAPKSYSILSQDGKSIIKHKGLAKSLVDEEWFENQYKDVTKKMETSVESNFRIEWDTLNIVKKSTLVTLSINVSNKRIPIFNNENVYVDTQPKEVIDYNGYNLFIQILKLRYDNASKDEELAAMKSHIITLKSKMEIEMSDDEKSIKEAEMKQEYQKTIELAKKENLMLDNKPPISPLRVEKKKA